MQLQLEAELLKVVKKSADVTHRFHLSECQLDVTLSGHVIGWCKRPSVSCSSEVPDVADVLYSPAERLEGPEHSETEADETSGSNQPAGSGSPAQVTLWINY